MSLSATTASSVIAAITNSGTAYVQLHTGDPGPDGLYFQASDTTRVPVAFTDDGGGYASGTGSANWAAWTGTAQTITHLSYWNAATAGAFLFSTVIDSPITLNTGDVASVDYQSIYVSPVG